MASKYVHLTMRRGRKIAKGHGAKTGGSPYWMMRKNGLRAGEKVRFARGTTRTSPWWK